MTATSKPRNSKPAADYFDRQPPMDLQAELGVLGSIFLLPDVLDDVALIVRPDDFYDDAHRTLFIHMAGLHEESKKIDATLLVDRLKCANVFEAIGGSAYLSKIINSVPNAAHATYYGEIVARKSRLREVIVACTVALRQAYDEDPSDEIVGTLESKLTALGQGHAQQCRLIADVAADALAEIGQAAASKTRRGAATGLFDLDDAMGPMLAGEMVVIAARTGQGKTALATQLALHNAEKGRPGLIISLEMRDRELVQRVLCGWAELDSRDVRAGRLESPQLEQLRLAADAATGLPLWIWDPGTATLADIRGVVRHAVKASGIQVVVVDYLGLVRPAGDERRLQRYEQVGLISSGLKRLAKESGVVVISLAQLNRDAVDEEPKLSHLRESGAIEQDADTVVLIHHPDTRQKNGTKIIGPAPPGPTDAFAIVAKHRHSQVCRVRLTWNPRDTRFASPQSF